VIVVCNTSPIINLAAINQLGLLHELYDEIIIPQAVYHEITVIGAGQPGANEVRKSYWIKTKEVNSKTLVKALKMELDDGEAEAIALSVELNADLLLIDEKIARSVASRFDLIYTGLLGLLIEAKSKGIIQKLKPVVDELKEKAGFWISAKLYFRTLSIVNES